MNIPKLVILPEIQNDTDNDTGRHFVKTAVSNLYSCKQGKRVLGYFMHAKIFGRLVRRSLGTKSFEVAKSKLKELHDAESARIKREREIGAVGTGTMAELTEEYLRRDKENQEIKESTKRYHRECVKAIGLTWPELAAMPVEAVKENACAEWARRLRKKYAATRYNGAIDVLRAILGSAVLRGVRVDNPASKLPKASPKAKELTLPTQDQFQSILKSLDDRKIGSRQRAAITIRFLAYSGMRTNEAGQLSVEMIDLDRGQFNLPGRVTKSGKPRSVPIIAEMKPLLEKLLADYKETGRRGPVLPCRDPSKSLETCCKIAGATRITNHDLRHLFITRCIESGVDVKTVASWVGHQDGGALILKTYAHLRNEHSQKMAEKVRFA